MIDLLFELIAILQKKNRYYFKLIRPNEFGSMTARKDNTSQIKSIFCHKRSIQEHKRPYKTMQGHTLKDPNR